MKNSVIQRISKSSGAIFLALVVSLAVWLGAVVLCFATLQNESAYSLVSGSVKTYEVTFNEDDKKEVKKEETKKEGAKKEKTKKEEAKKEEKKPADK